MSNPTIKLASKNGEVRSIKGLSVFRSMGADAIFHNSGSTIINSTPYTLSNNDKEWLVWQINKAVELEIVADSSGSDGQGLNIRFSNANCEVTDVQGNVYIVRGKDIDMADNKADIYTNANRIAANKGDSLYLNDAIVAEAAASTGFTIEVTWPDNLVGALKYLAYAAVEEALSLE